MRPPLPVDYSAYVPCCNNAPSLRSAVAGVLEQSPAPAEVLVIDDGSADDPAAVLAGLPVRLIRHGRNLGRGAARARAMAEARHAFVLCCDATNVLPPGFAARALAWMDDGRVAAVFGPIFDPAPRTLADRWRARHLFKQETPATTARPVNRRATFATMAALVRASAVARAGGFDPALRHAEDADLGARLLAAGDDVVLDPALVVHCNVRNSLGEVLERYRRWHAGPAEKTDWRSYGAWVRYALSAMVRADLRAGDFGAAAVSAFCPHYQFWKTRRRRRPRG